jgi:hypothetical protein
LIVKPPARPAPPFSKPIVFLIALAAIYATGLSIVAAHAIIPKSEKTQTLWTIFFALILTWWLYADRHVRRFNVPYDFETFAFFAWPVVVPYYLYRTRGVRGLLLGLGIGGLYLVPYVAAAVVYVTRIVSAHH